MNAAPGAGPRQDLIRHGTPDFRRANLGLFAAGVATFGLLYCVQPLMPEFSRQFGVGAAQSALSLSLPSATIAIAMLFAGPVSDALGRKALMSVSLACSTLVVLLSAAAPSWADFLVLRALLGLTLSGLPAVAMAYLTEEMHPDSMGLGMGLYIGGNAAGGLGGRLIAGVLTGYFGWRVGVAAVGVIGGIAAGVFVRCLPASRHFIARPLRLAASMQGFAALFRDPALPWLFAAGFVLLGSVDRPPRRPIGAAQGPMDHVRDHARRLGIHGAEIGRADRGRNRHHHLWFLRRPFDRQQLGRPPRQRRQGPGLLDLSVHLLHGVERCRRRGRIVLCR